MGDSRHKDVRVEVRASYSRAFLSALDRLLGEGALVAADRLTEAALIRVPEALARHPRMGRDYLARNPGTPRLQETLEAVRQLLGADIELREILLGDHLVLYAVHGNTVHLLTLRHHRQSGFKLDG